MLIVIQLESRTALCASFMYDPLTECTGTGGVGVGHVVSTGSTSVVGFWLVLGGGVGCEMC